MPMESLRHCVECSGPLVKTFHYIRCFDCRFKRRRINRARGCMSKVINCISCGREFISRSNIQVRCVKCQRVIKRFNSNRKSVRRHHNIRHSGISHTYEQWVSLKAKFGNKCLRCGTSDRYGKLLTRDHVVPLSKGGSDSIDNIQPLCQKCNSSKNNKTMDYRVDNFLVSA